MFFFVALLLTVCLGSFSFLIVRQYRRVQKRDEYRRRVQTYQSKNHISSFENDPLDHSLYWYPVAFSHEVPSGSKRPFAFELLNEPLCLFRRNDGELVCVLDLCPHRSAPLSLGEITIEGNLECVYHGWQYGANGQCVYIPSVSKQSNTSSLICARTKPVHEQYGFIWIWPGKLELAHSHLIPHGIFSDLQKINSDYILSPENTFNLKIPYELMIDNLLDLAHIDFTHNGTIGKRSQATCIKAQSILPSLFFSTNSESTTFKLTKPEQINSSNDYSHMNFIPPCFVRLEHYQTKESNVFIQIFIILPSSQNKMRLLIQFYRNFARYKWIEYIPGYDYLMAKFNTKIVDQDLLLLNGIDRNLVEMGAKSLGTLVSADAPIKAFRQYQIRTLNKYKTIYVQQQIWTNNPNDNIDIEDLKID